MYVYPEEKWKLDVVVGIYGRNKNISSVYILLLYLMNSGQYALFNECFKNSLSRLDVYVLIVNVKV